MDGKVTFATIIADLIGIALVILPVLMSLASLVFFWGLAKLIYASGKGDETGVSDGKKRMLWGVVGLFVMITFLAIIIFLRSEAGLGIVPRNSSGVIPLLPTN